MQQDDILFQTMTVRECLEFAARLKLPGTDEQKIARVDVLLKNLKLIKCQNTRIGGPLVKGVSGGERKRTSVGVELITDPSLIFLDEPTTGLDSFTATQVMGMLRDMAYVENRTVISTIHQPNSDIFELFDYLSLLARGKIIYFNKASKSVDYFTSIGFQCPEMSNPCDYFMSMMSKESIELDLEEEGQSVFDLDNEKINAEYEKLIQFFDAKYHLSELRCDASQVHPECPPLEGDEDIVNIKVSFCYQWKLLATRNFNNIVRLPQTSYVKLMTTTITALFASFLFWQTGPTNGGIQNVQGALFFMTMNCSFNAIQNVILIFPDERPVFLREVNNNMYEVTPYFWAKIVSEIPFSIIVPTVFGCIVYYCVGLKPDAGNFFVFLIILILIYNSFSGYSLIISASFSNKQLAVTLTPVLIVPFMLFAGFFVASSNIPYWLKEFEYLSIIKYGYQALMQNQFNEYYEERGNSDAYYYCLGGDGDGNPNPAGAQPNCDAITTTGCCNPLSQLGDQSMVSSMLCLLGLYVSCYLISWCILMKLSKSYND